MITEKAPRRCGVRCSARLGGGTIRAVGTHERQFQRGEVLFRDGPQGIDTLVENPRQVFEEPGVVGLERK